MIPKDLKELKSLVCFEEITDYSLIKDAQIKKGLKRKAEPIEPTGKKAKVISAESVETKKSSKKKEPKKKSVKFNEDVIVLNSEEIEKSAKKNKKKSKKNKPIGAFVKIDKKNPVKKAKKQQKSNSTSRLTLHTNIEAEDEIDQADFEEKMKAWSDLMLPKVLLRGLYEKGFFQPMPIQKIVLPEAIKNRSNIIGTAQTGSGKTLAFGLPILTQLIDSYEFKLDKESNENSGPQALVLTPTRELAIQIKDHLQVCSKYQDIKIAVVVGGISQIKQERLLKKNPEIVVATPGRLMQLIEEGNEYLQNIWKIKFLVIDEADRMIEKGHFSEMEKILGIVNSEEKTKAKRQNFLFSATLITKYGGDYDDKKFENENGEIDEKKKKKLEAKKRREEKAALNALVDKIQMVKDPKVFDLTTAAVTADNLVESKIFCPLKEKDTYLYYFSCKYSGRTLVFANSIDCVRRLTNLFRLLKRTPLHLHANMDQKQRLKNLEKFNAEENALLIASDVASRGLDIPGVKHVIHYQVPRSAEIYVHRSGRTARSNFDGLSVMLVSPDEINLYRKIIKTFKKDKEIKDYPIDIDYLDECKKRVNLARSIDELEHQLSKEKSTTSWYEKHAKLLDIELDDEILKETHVDSDKNAKNKRKLNQMKQQLESQLKKMIFPRNMSKKYLQLSQIDQVLSINKSDHLAIEDMRNSKKENFKKIN